MITENSTDRGTSTDWTWLGPLMLWTAAVFAVLIPERTPFMVIVYAVVIFSGTVLCIHDQREKHHG